MSKKSNLFLLVILSCSTMLLHAQQDSTIISHSQEVAIFEDQQFVDAHDFVFQTFEETQSLWKLDLTGVLLSPPIFSQSVKYFLQQNWGLAYERKISPAFSINNELQFFYSLHDDPPGNRTFGLNAIGFSFSVQPRWYYDMKKRMTQNKTANNLSGNYFAFDADYQYSFGKNNYKARNTSIGLRFGIQRRIFGRGFIDIQFGPQYSWIKYEHLTSIGEIRKIDNKYFGLGSRIAVGIALGKSKLDIDAAQRCDVFRCFKEKRQLFKIDFLQAINFTVGALTGLSQWINGTFTMSHEFKIGKHISINNELVTNYSFSHYDPPLTQLTPIDNPFGPGPAYEIQEINHDFRFDLQFRTQFRHYYDQRKRIAQGKSANNLSGNYWGVELGTSKMINYSTLNNNITGSSFKRDIQLLFSPIWGMQRTIFKRAYIDYTLGFALASVTLKEGNQFSRYFQEDALIGTNEVTFQPISRLRIGLAF